MKKIKLIALWLGALVIIATALLYADADLLWKVQQNDLFLFSSLFFKQTMVESGGMLSYLGAFFTQFFYYPWIGVILLCGWWLLLMWLTKRAFSIPDKWNILSLIPVAILLIANMDMGYWVYVMKLRGYFFVATIGTTVGVALLWLFRLLPQNLWVRVAYVVLVVLAAYPLMGIYALITALLMGIWIWRLSDNRTQNVIISIAALLAIVAIPLFYYHFVYHQTNITHIYLTAIPDYGIDKDYNAYKIPYYVLAACFLAFVIAYRKPSLETPAVQTLNTEKKEPKGKKNDKNTKAKKPVLLWTLQGALLAALAFGVWHFWYKDANFHHELRMERCLEKADWEGIVEEGKAQNDEPTRAIVLMHNLALSRLGRQCDEMYNFPKGSKRSATPIPVYMYNTAGYQINYNYGLLNECHRLCMETGVEFGWNAELLQYMARSAMLGGEKAATRKYLSLLRQTLFFGSWADRMETLLNTPGEMYADNETGPVTRMLHYANIQGEGDSYVEKNLMMLLAELDSDDPYFQEQAVLAAMWTRNPNFFWPRFQKYAQLHPNDLMPRIFQEAAYLFANMEHRDFTERLPVSPGVKESFRGFMSDMKQYQQMNPNQVRSYLYPKYGNTYYFEFFFLRDITYF